MGSTMAQEDILKAIRDMIKKNNKYIPTAQAVVNYICSTYHIDEDVPGARAGGRGGGHRPDRHVPHAADYARTWWTSARNSATGTPRCSTLDKVGKADARPHLRRNGQADHHQYKCQSHGL